MRLLHTADLHLGKRVNGYSMIDDQRFILQQMLDLAEKNEVDAFLVAGDVYDTVYPPEDAVNLLDEFLSQLADRGIQAVLTAGNHDSGPRLDFGHRLIASRGIHVRGTWRGKLEPITLHNKQGVEVDIWPLPFIRPSDIRFFLRQEDEELAQDIKTYEDAVRFAISTAHLDGTRINIAIAHQFVTASGVDPLRSDSERVQVGTLDNLDVSCFDSFDYVALGHIHRPQAIGRETSRYAGSPLKYSFSEAAHKKSVTLITCDAAAKAQGHDSISLEQLPLKPQRDMREVSGTLNEVLQLAHTKPEEANDYLHVTLTDDEEHPDAFARVRLAFPNLMLFDYNNARTRAQGAGRAMQAPQLARHPELFSDFFAAQNGKDLSDEQREIVESIFDEILTGRSDIS